MYPGSDLLSIGVLRLVPEQQLRISLTRVQSPYGHYNTQLSWSSLHSSKRNNTLDTPPGLPSHQKGIHTPWIPPGLPSQPKGTTPWIPPGLPSQPKGTTPWIPPANRYERASHCEFLKKSLW
ncbi:hypothetical protein Taro_046891 [Colocasia esculenta]|uniref:Uncharacterized protein n=1 Tax=Colocasia esculenta TaxID=4460 RepID=A0A843X6N0_COLES|nr:hypothetical protein [Colocasia esculenta]